VRRAGVIVAVLLRAAVRGLQTSPLPSIVATATIAIALVLVGAFALVLGSMEAMLERFGEELHVVAYLDASLPEGAQRGLVERVGQFEGVESALLVTREQALERFRETLGGGELIAGLDHNPLPPSVEIELVAEARNEAGIESVVTALEQIEGVDDLAHGQQWVEGYARLASLVRSAAVALGTVLIGAALLIVANTIRLALYAREDELEILSLIGAGRLFQRAPFILEGLAEGALGGLIALGVLYLAFHGFQSRVEFGLSLLLGSSVPQFLAVGQAAVLVAVGAALGAVGSGVALVSWRR